jgi:hypothetical protein
MLDREALTRSNISASATESSQPFWAAGGGKRLCPHILAS